LNLLRKNYNRNLTELRLQSNFIEKIPESICQLHSLAILDLTKNSLTNLPNDLQGFLSFFKKH